jgi:hypothetical protein
MYFAQYLKFGPYSEDLSAVFTLQHFPAVWWQNINTDFVSSAFTIRPVYLLASNWASVFYLYHLCFPHIPLKADVRLRFSVLFCLVQLAALRRSDPQSKESHQLSVNFSFKLISNGNRQDGLIYQRRRRRRRRRRIYLPEYNEIDIISVV